MVENKSMWFAEKTRMRERWMGGGLNALKEKNEMQRLFFLGVERNCQRMDEQPNPPSTLGISSGFPMENNCPGCHLGQTAEVRYRFLGRGAHCLPLKTTGTSLWIYARTPTWENISIRCTNSSKGSLVVPPRQPSCLTYFENMSRFRESLFPVHPFLSWLRFGIGFKFRSRLRVW